MKMSKKWPLCPSSQGGGEGGNMTVIQTVVVSGVAANGARLTPESPLVPTWGRKSELGYQQGHGPSNLWEQALCPLLLQGPPSAGRVTSGPSVLL